MLRSFAPRLPRLLRTSTLALAVSSLAACQKAPEAAPSSAARLADPRAESLWAALERGQVGSARSLLAALGAALGPDQPLAAARLALAEGDAVGALRQVEQAKSAWPADPRVYATACELFAGLGRLGAAQAEFDQGVALCGRTPELIRSQGILGLSTPGQVELGVRLLESARAADPGLPFVGVALTRGRAVLARLALGEGRGEDARRWLSSGLAEAPDDGELRHVAAQLDLAERRFPAARAALEALQDEGLAVREDLLLALRADAAEALIAGDRARNVSAYLRMLELGVPREQLGFGADVLAREAEARLQAGLEAFELGEKLPIDAELDAAVRAEAIAARVRLFEKAEASFRSALDFDPDSLEARHRLGEALYRMGDFEAAAREWEAVQLLARGSEYEGSGVHLNIARAWRGAGHSDRALRVLEEYLSEHPRGDHVEQTESLLRSLSSPPR
jgi:tetratricopeptide (TPR) repeat protein